MIPYFLDTSALIKRYVAEVGSAWVGGMCDPAAGNSIYLARITHVEVTAAVSRRRKSGSLSATDAAMLLGTFQTHWDNQYVLVDITLAFLARAAKFAETHALRAYDAVQFAVFAEVNDLRATQGLLPLVLVSADMELNAAATAEGFAVEDPNAHP